MKYIIKISFIDAHTGENYKLNSIHSFSPERVEEINKLEQLKGYKYIEEYKENNSNKEDNKESLNIEDKKETKKNKN